MKGNLVWLGLGQRVFFSLCENSRINAPISGSWVTACRSPTPFFGTDSGSSGEVLVLCEVMAFSVLGRAILLGCGVSHALREGLLVVSDVNECQSGNGWRTHL